MYSHLDCALCVRNSCRHFVCALHPRFCSTLLTARGSTFTLGLRNGMVRRGNSVAPRFPEALFRVGYKLSTFCWSCPLEIGEGSAREGQIRTYCRIFDRQARAKLVDKMLDVQSFMFGLVGLFAFPPNLSMTFPGGVNILDAFTCKHGGSMRAGV